MLIHIFIHPLDDFERSGYLLTRMIPVWRQQGIECQVISDVAQATGDADAAINHVDLTCIPPEYDAVFARYPIVINGSARDISKRVVSRSLVTKDDDYQGPVIVKTDRNFGGHKEAELARNSGLFRKCKRSLRRRLPWYFRNELPGKTYPVFESKREVPWPVWHNPALVVEQFTAETHDGFKWLRTWHFLGDQEFMMLRWSNHNIVAIPNLMGAKFITPDVPPELRIRRRKLGFDYGKFDFVLAEGKPILFDANRTPTSRLAFADEQLATLATSLPSFIMARQAQATASPACVNAV